MGRTANPPYDLADLPPSGGLTHATTVAVGPNALLISGASGSGKSSLALRLMAFGASLIADDRTHLAPRNDGPPLASAPDAIRGLIEARGVGVLRVETKPAAPVAAILDLDVPETERIPPRRTTVLCGCELPLFHNADSPHFPAALLLYLRGGAREQ